MSLPFGRKSAAEYAAVKTEAVHWQQEAKAAKAEAARKMDRRKPVKIKPRKMEFIAKLDGVVIGRKVSSITVAPWTHAVIVQFTKEYAEQLEKSAAPHVERWLPERHLMTPHPTTYMRHCYEWVKIVPIESHVLTEPQRPPGEKTELALRLIEQQLRTIRQEMKG